MAVETLVKNTSISQLTPPSGVSGGAAKVGFDPAAAAEFRGALDKAGRLPGAAGPAASQAPALAGARAAAEGKALQFSAHAVERMRSRGIAFAPEMMTRIEGAVAKAAAKGSKDTLILAGDAAMIVSVKNNTVVTVMDRASMKENVFTNIDSTVVL